MALLRFGAVALFVVGGSVAIVRANVQTYDTTAILRQGFTDARNNVSVMSGEPVSLWARRPLVPWLAARAPALPYSWFSSERLPNPGFDAAVKFGIVNFAFLIGACLALYALCVALHLSFGASFLSTALMLTSPTIVRNAGLPLTDTAFFFFFALAALALVRRSLGLLCVVLAAGIVTKELILLALPLALLLPAPWRTRLRFAAPAAVAALAYGFVMWHNAPTRGFVNAALNLQHARNTLGVFSTPNGWINLFLVFGFAWLAAAYAIRRQSAPPVLLRWAWMVPFVLVGVIIALGGVDRGMFTVFPIVLPLAACGTLELLGYRWQAGEVPEDRTSAGLVDSS